MPNQDLPDPFPRRRTRSFVVSGPHLRSLRAGRGWTQREAAARAGFTDRLIRKAEAGGAIDANSIAVLARLYSTPERPLTARDLLVEPFDVSSAEPLPMPTGVTQPRARMEELAVRWFKQLWNQRRLKVIKELAAPDILLHVEGRQVSGRGCNTIRKFRAEHLTY